MIPVSRSSPVTVVVISGKVFIPALGPLIIKGAGASPEVGIQGPAQTCNRSDVEATYALRNGSATPRPWGHDPAWAAADRVSSATNAPARATMAAMRRAVLIPLVNTSWLTRVMRAAI